MNKYRQYKNLNLSQISDEIQKYWKDNNIFAQSITEREGAENFVFYEGPPSANGLPGIHHVLARTIKDIFCRYKTLQGFQVKRKAGWDTHGLPVEIEVEKKLGITKDDIGRKISIEDYNKECRSEVMKFKTQWDDLTVNMGFWLDLDNPYITFENKYIETVWWLLSQLYEKGLLYKGYSIQPYSPAAGTGLSTHELNLPGCYKNIKDNTVVAQFKVVNNEKSKKFFVNIFGDLYFLAWTTTPWTLPSNTALAMNAKVNYVIVQTYNQYTHQPQTVILAKDLSGKYFPEENVSLNIDEYKAGQKQIPFKVVNEVLGSEFEGFYYEQLLPYQKPTDGDAFCVLLDNFVTTEEGTGIVHIAPSFGADDFRVAKKHSIGSLTMVDKQGKFVVAMGEFAGKFVRPEFDINFDPKTMKSVDVEIIIKLKNENKAFKTEKYEHSYPHCWRTDKPILYYPLDSWFIKTTEFKNRMLELNETINWKPASIGTGRFGNWLENLVDWNLSRSRYWGVPLPVWTSKDKSEQICISSIAMLKSEINKSVEAGFMKSNPLENFEPENFAQENYQKFDIHRPYVDDIILVSKSGKKMFRETDLIDVWFDSGAMPYAQFHYPFENKELFEKNFPADFIAEGVDQTRGWFFTLHAIASMLFDSVAFKTVVSNGLVLDKNGNKMSKRIGNIVDPYEVINKYGADALRWFMISNSQPWDNLKFDIEGVLEIQRKFFGTLYNIYAFFSLYANIDNFKYEEEEIEYSQRPEIDRWILSELNSLVQRVGSYYDDYEPTKAARDIQDFTLDCLSNWYVRLCRRRFWKGEYSEDKISAYQTLYTCLETIAIISSPIAPFYMERLFTDLNTISNKRPEVSVHLAQFSKVDKTQTDSKLERRMQLAQKISSMILSLRKRSNIRVRQPLQKVIIPVNNKKIAEQLNKVKDIIKAEVNIKEIELLTDSKDFLVKSIKPNYKVLGPRFGKTMKQVADAISKFDNDDINNIETYNKIEITVNDEKVEIFKEDVEIITQDIPGWLVLNEGSLTVALDITITEELELEGIAREFVNKIQNLRKDIGLEVTDKIILKYEDNFLISLSIKNNYLYICNEILAEKLEASKNLKNNNSVNINILDNIKVNVVIEKIE